MKIESGDFHAWQWCEFTNPNCSTQFYLQNRNWTNLWCKQSPAIEVLIWIDEINEWAFNEFVLLISRSVIKSYQCVCEQYQLEHNRAFNFHFSNTKRHEVKGCNHQTNYRELNWNCKAQSAIDWFQLSYLKSLLRFMRQKQAMRRHLRLRAFYNLFETEILRELFKLAVKAINVYITKSLTQNFHWNERVSSKLDFYAGYLPSSLSLTHFFTHTHHVTFPALHMFRGILIS